jgi:hypothetical protein
VNDRIIDELNIRQLVERWAVWRDAGDFRGPRSKSFTVAGFAGSRVERSSADRTSIRDATV